MAYVTPRDGESAESLVNRFRASVQHSGVLRELKTGGSSAPKCRKSAWLPSGRQGAGGARAGVNPLPSRPAASASRRPRFPPPPRQR